MNYWLKKICWICLGTGWVKGPLYREPCPAPSCPHREEQERDEAKKRRKA